MTSPFAVGFCWAADSRGEISSETAAVMRRSIGFIRGLRQLALRWTGSPGLVEPFAKGKAKAGEDVSAIEELILCEQGRVLRRSVDAGRPFSGINIPDETNAGLEELTELPVHLSLGVPLAENLDHEVRGKVGDRSQPPLG